jgi:hypothetical protein
VDNTLSSSQQRWEDTWQGIWAPISEDGEQPTPTPIPTTPVPPTTKSVASRTPIGLIIGAAIGALALVATAIAVFCFKRRRKTKDMNTAQPVPDPPSPDDKAFPPGLIEQMRRHHLSVPRELTAGEVAAELAGYFPEPLPAKPIELHGKNVYYVTKQTPLSPVELDSGDIPLGYGLNASRRSMGRGREGYGI